MVFKIKLDYPQKPMNTVKRASLNLDHLMWACPDLAAGIDEIETLTGVRAEYSGSHLGLGTRNALLSLGGTCYLEIIAPDPNQVLEGNFGGRLAALKSTGLLSWAMACTDLANLKSKLLANGISSREVQTTRREGPSGEMLVWELLFTSGIKDAPFFIDWLECAHPAITSPAGCEIKRLTVGTPGVVQIGELIDGVALVDVVESDVSELQATIQSPRGDVIVSPLCSAVRLF
jgi:hypothetical protein